jgi:SAM-dependent methyltransferase
MRRFQQIVRRTGVKPRRALEVGGVMGKGSLLRFPELAGAERFCLNLASMPSADGITSITGNANHMDMFEDDSFDLVLCCSTLEHDKHFWLSVAEMQRVMSPGGLLVIGVPGYTKRDDDEGRSTRTYRVHFKFDYYRFSEQAVREVFFEGMENVKVSAVLTPPRLIAHGRKPGGRDARIAAAEAVRGLRGALPSRA